MRSERRTERLHGAHRQAISAYIAIYKREGIRYNSILSLLLFFRKFSLLLPGCLDDPIAAVLSHALDVDVAISGYRQVAAVFEAAVVFHPAVSATVNG